jgi:hypothetical protein
VPPEIARLTNLIGLYLFNNRLISVPPEIGRLRNLTTLFVSEKGVMEWNNDRGQRVLSCADGKWQEIYKVDEQSYEVIGNTYQNPELLPRN